MRFYEVDSSVDAIMSAAMLAQTRASSSGKQGKLSINGFLQMLANAGIMMDYDGFKTVFDTNPQLKNVIAQFNKDEITFVGDSDDEGAGYEEPQGDMPDDERVAKMAQRATKMRTEEFVETTLTEFDRHQDIIDQIVDMQPETSNEIIRMAQKLGAPDRAIDDILQAVLDKVNIDEAELPPHLSKMFGKDGTQVDTRTDVMKQMRDIVDNKSAMEVTFGDGKQMVDMYTASVLVQIYDKVNPENKEKIVQRVGTIEKFTKLMPRLFNMIGEGKSPHKKGTEKYRKHMAAMHAGESVNEAWQAFKEGAPKMKYALVGTDMKIYAIGSDERDLRLDRTSLDKRFPDAAPLKMARLKTAQRIGDTVGSDQIKERSLTKPEKRKMKHYEKKLPKSDFIDRYGKEQGEAIYYATATKMAKKNA